ncbi:MAG: M3 family metallopeptidase, partial [Flavobacteriaceae bacterium]
REYFPLKQTLEGLFAITKKLYQLEFELINNVDPYHNDVSVYKVTKTNGHYVALLYLDFYPRESKRSGAWMTSFKSQHATERPHISIVCNFSKPTKEKPALLTFSEVTTLFHEFGHALHGMLAQTVYSGLSGTSVYWDFVELPSQIMENWCYQKEALHHFAKHYKTQEPLPEHYIEKIEKVAQFQQGLQTLRQLSFAYLDMSYHTTHEVQIVDIKKHEKALFEPFSFTPDQEENCMSTAFSHIFQGGYAAGYYSYKWAEVLDADAFELFLEKGIFDTNTAANFEEHILSKGGTEHPMELYKRFRKKAPNPEALLKRAGLIDWNFFRVSTTSTV